jgi:hypothetical protein
MVDLPRLKFTPFGALVDFWAVMQSAINMREQIVSALSEWP